MLLLWWKSSKKTLHKYYLEKIYKRWQKNITEARINKNIKPKEETKTINKDKTSTKQKPEVNVANRKETHDETQKKYIKKKEKPKKETSEAKKQRWILRKKSQRNSMEYIIKKKTKETNRTKLKNTNYWNR